jgi:proline iminopeptidase
MPEAAPEPYATGLLETGDGNRIYWETVGNPDGVPVLIVHGGPGYGCTVRMRRPFDLQRHRVILFDQRNCGRSLPHASDPSADMSRNTTQHLLHDMERLRGHLGVEKWMLFGGSWGSALALAYAEAHPDRVSAVLLVSVMTARKRELDWLYRGAGAFFPEAWEKFRDAAEVGARFRSPRGSELPIEQLLAGYGALMEDGDPTVRARAAAAWQDWEDVLVSGEVNGTRGLFSNRPDDAVVAFVRICAHYFAHGAFLDDGVLLREAHRLAGIPAIVVHGRNDISLPAITAWELARAWPGAELIIVDDAGHTGSATMRETLRDARERLAAMVAERATT